MNVCGKWDCMVKQLIIWANQNIKYWLDRLASAICSNLSWSRFGSLGLCIQALNLSCSTKSSATASPIPENCGVPMKVVIALLTAWGVVRFWKKISSAKTVKTRWTWKIDVIEKHDDINQCQSELVFEVQKVVVPERWHDKDPMSNKPGYRKWLACMIADCKWFDTIANASCDVVDA